MYFLHNLKKNARRNRAVPNQLIFILNVVSSPLPDFAQSDIFVNGSKSVAKCDKKTKKQQLAFPSCAIPSYSKNQGDGKFHQIFFFFFTHNDRVCSHCCQRCWLLWKPRLDAAEALIHVSLKTWGNSTCWSFGRFQRSVESNNLENKQLDPMSYMVRLDLLGARKSLSALEKSTSVPELTRIY